MVQAFANRLSKRSLNRRDFLWLISLSTAGWVLAGCGKDPVTGKNQLVLMSESEEISLDQKQSPQQFSMDYGPCQDKALNAYVRSGEYASYAPYLDKIGGFGAGALLASYSRNDEREADRLGMQYMVQAGYNPRGMEGLMAILVQKSKHEPNALELMFATHPMSQDRYDMARKRAGERWCRQSCPSAFDNLGVC